jgi:hypothetical protein
MSIDTIMTEEIAKRFIPVFFAALLGALAHAFDEVSKVGWKGWVLFLSDIVICLFTGFTFYHVALLVYPSATVIFTSLGSYWGTKGFIILKDWFITTLRANLK